MTAAEIETLKQSCGKRVEICYTDGEVVLAEVLSVSDFERDVVYDLVSTNTPGRYAGRPVNAARLTSFDEIESIRVVHHELG